ncbi:MAG: hypothetical protein RBT61_11210 [Candidatus Kapabacteria bacterium]|jgi:hypothetical protein|nr:hypothetical protein [Candidatus Kapabacteria bacterium]
MALLFCFFLERWQNSSSVGFLFWSVCWQKPNVLECVSAVFLTLGGNGWGCEKCWRLGQRPNPTIRSIEKAD